MSWKQQQLLERIKYLESSLSGYDSEEQDDNIDELLNRELNDCKNKIDEINEVFNVINIDEINNIIKEQYELRAYVEELNRIQEELSKTTSEDQLNRLLDTEKRLKELIAKYGEENSADIDKLNEELELLDNETRAALDELSKLLNDNAESQEDDLNNILSDLTGKLDNEVSILKDLLNNNSAEQSEALTLLTEDLITKLEFEISILKELLNNNDMKQSEALLSAISKLETLINNEVADLREILESNGAKQAEDLLDTVEDLKRNINTEVTDIRTNINDNDKKQAEAVDTAVKNLTDKIDNEVELLEEVIKNGVQESDLTDTANEFTNKLNDESNQLKTLIAEKANAQEVEGSINDLAAVLEGKIDALKPLIKANEDKNIELTEAVENLDTLLSAMGSDLDGLEVDIEAKDTELRGIINNVNAALSQEVTRIDEEIAKLENDLTAKINDVVQDTTLKYTELSDRLTQVEDSVKALKTLTDEHTDSIGVLNTEITTLKNSVQTLEGSVSDLQANQYQLPIASATTLGGVKVDGTTITIDANGVISAVENTTSTPTPVTYTVSIYNGSSLYNTYTCAENGQLTLPNLGIGFSTSSSATTATYSAGGKITVTKNMTLYVVKASSTPATEYTYTVNLYKYGTLYDTLTTTTTASTGTFTLPSCTADEGDTFYGWSTSSSSTTLKYRAGDTVSTSGVLKLYAIFSYDTISSGGETVIGSSNESEITTRTITIPASCLGTVDIYAYHTSSHTDWYNSSNNYSDDTDIAIDSKNVTVTINGTPISKSGTNSETLVPVTKTVGAGDVIVVTLAGGDSSSGSGSNYSWSHSNYFNVDVRYKYVSKTSYRVKK